MRSNAKLIVLGTACVFVLAACTMPVNSPNAVATLQALYTAQVSTVQVMQTQISRGTLTPGSAGDLPTIPPGTILPNTQLSPTLTPETVLSMTPIPTLTSQPESSLTPLPTSTSLPLPSSTPVPTSAPTSYCNAASFIKDVTIPDGDVLAPGEVFTKTWRLKNIGTCDWTTSYGIVFYKGNNMAGRANINLPKRVNRGDTIDISVDLVAPLKEGTYRGYWFLEDGKGNIFGTGDVAANPFYVEIEVSTEATTVYNFASAICEATWQSGAGILPCPGILDSPEGYALRVNKPRLENGKIYNGVGLLMAPEDVSDGFIRGTYPAYKVHAGDHFRAIIGCKYQAAGCLATFQLDYQIGNGPILTFWESSEKYDGKYYSVDKDLTPLAGHSVKFILTIFSDGSADKDKLIWAGPRIER